MTATPPLSPTMTRAVLDYLGAVEDRPSLSHLDSLIAAYTRAVPWESASRIARRAQVANTADCPRWPETFWAQAIESGTGGTCFESNYAFFSLLRAIGYEGYLTINDMPPTIGCHTAIVVQLDGERWIADAGIPIYTALRLETDTPTERASPFLTYTVRPEAAQRYRIERRPHPRPGIFTLLDRPIADPDYRAATTADYSETGLFLHQVIVNKVIDDMEWRFSSAELPYRMDSFRDGERFEHPISGDVAEAVGNHFGIDTSIVRRALEVTGG